MSSESESVYNTDKNVAEVSKLTNSIKSQIQDSNITPNIIGYKYIPPNRNNQTEIIDENFIGTMTANTMKECESLIVIELKSGYAVELIENDIDIPVCNVSKPKT
jgi:hypothetical protein